MKLSELQTGVNACISKLNLDNDIKYHLMERGLVPNTTFKLLAKNDYNYIIVYRDITLSIDSSLACNIEVI